MYTSIIISYFPSKRDNEGNINQGMHQQASSQQHHTILSQSTHFVNGQVYTFCINLLPFKLVYIH